MGFSYTVYAILFCGSSNSQYLAELSYDSTAKALTYLKRTAVSPVTYGPQHVPRTVRLCATRVAKAICQYTGQLVSDGVETCTCGPASASTKQIRSACRGVHVGMMQSFGVYVWLV